MFQVPNPFQFRLSVSVKRRIKIINVIRFQVLFIVSLSLFRVLTQGESTITRGDADLVGCVCGLGRNLERAPQLETQSARAFMRGRGGGSAGDGQAGYAARNVRASWRLKPSLGMYSACPGTARILLNISRRQPRAAHAVGRIPSRRQCPPSWLSDNWILSIKPTNVNRENAIEMIPSGFTLAIVTPVIYCH